MFVFVYSQHFQQSIEKTGYGLPISSWSAGNRIGDFFPAPDAIRSAKNLERLDRQVVHHKQYVREKGLYSQIREWFFAILEAMTTD